jgi:type I restriction enzyme, S subunit
MKAKTKTTATKEEATPALVPKLRFPEFRGAEGWNRECLGSLGNFTRGLTYSSSDVSTEGLLVLRSTNIQDGGLVLDRDLVFVSKTCPDALRLKEGDIVVCMSNGSKALVGKSGEYFGDYSDDLTVGAFCSFYRPAFPFAKLAFQIDSYQRYVADLIAGGNINNLTNSVLEEFSFPVPQQPAEQQKIAECLSSVDELMAAQARKVDALKTHKKGLMQQLFPREGETQPRLRFPEFQNAGEWVVKKLEEIGRVIRGASPRPKGDPRYYGGPIPRLMVQDVTRDGKWVTPQIDSLTEEGAKLSRPCPAGTLTIVCSGAVGVVSFLAVDACIHDGFLALVDIDESLASKDFLFHRLSTLREQFERGATHGGVFTNLTTTGVDQLEIACPGPAEQQRIATCLSSLDALITAETQKLEALKTHKRGLMQQLFPSPEEVAG